MKKIIAIALMFIMTIAGQLSSDIGSGFLKISLERSDTPDAAAAASLFIRTDLPSAQAEGRYHSEDEITSIEVHVR